MLSFLVRFYIATLFCIGSHHIRLMEPSMSKKETQPYQGAQIYHYNDIFLDVAQQFVELCPTSGLCFERLIDKFFITERTDL